jgi:hypothetical protein
VQPTILVAQDKLEHQDRMLEDIAMLQNGLSEDYVIGESIQAGIASGVNTHFHFGQFEGGLSHFHQAIERMLG